MSKEYKVTDRGIICINDTDCKVIIPREIFTEAVQRYCNPLANRRKKQFESPDNCMRMRHCNLDPDERCSCGYTEYVLEYDEYNDRLYVICPKCGFTGEILPKNLKQEFLQEGFWRYEEFLS